MVDGYRCEPEKRNNTGNRDDVFSSSCCTLKVLFLVLLFHTVRRCTTRNSVREEEEKRRHLSLSWQVRQHLLQITIRLLFSAISCFYSPPPLSPSHSFAIQSIQKPSLYLKKKGGPDATQGKHEDECGAFHGGRGGIPFSPLYHSDHAPQPTRYANNRTRHQRQ